MKLRIAGHHHQLLYTHLFPGDGHEAVALALCGQARSGAGQAHPDVLTVCRVEPVPYEFCAVRTPDQVTWATAQILPELLCEAQKRHLLLLKIHSHPGGWPKFSRYDDQADRELFSGVAGWLDVDIPGGSVIMLPDGRLVGRVCDAHGRFLPLSSIAVAGDEIRVWQAHHGVGELPAYAARTAQAFGTGTTTLLSRLSVAVIGCSGTGSPLIEMLARLGVGELVLVDPDVVEAKNLNRIYNTTAEDAHQQRYKANVLAAAVTRMELGTRVVPIANSLFDPQVVRRVAQCDVVFGCMDSVDGRALLNRLATFYVLPYIDVGVRLIADGQQGISQICGSVHYLQPGSSSLFTRGVYTSEQLRAAGMYRADPDAYRDQLQQGYIQGVAEERPAVISVNSFYASLAVNEFLARLHPFRDDPNRDYATVTFSLSQMRLISEEDGPTDEALAREVGRGDIVPLLNRPELSE